MIKSINQFTKFSFLFYNHLGKMIFIIIILTSVTGLLDVIGITMIIPLFHVLLQENGALDSSNEIWILEYFLGADKDYALNYLFFILVSVFVLKGVVLFSSLTTNGYILSRFLSSLKKRFFENFMKIEYSYFLQKDTGYFANIANEQANFAIMSFSQYAKLISYMINILIYLTALLLIAWKLSIAALLSGILIIALFRPVSRYIATLSKERAEVNGELAQKLIQAIQAFKYLKATEGFKPIAISVSKSIDQISRLNFLSTRASSIILGLREPLLIVMLLSFVVLQMQVFEDSFGLTLASILLFYRLLNSIVGLQVSWQATMNAVGSLQLYDQSMKDFRANSENHTGNLLTQGPLDVEFDSIYYNFPGSSGFSLNKINLKVYNKSTVALVGASGSGKSSIVNMITCLLKSKEGKLYFNGLDVAVLDRKDLRSKIGYVSQEPIIFDDTIEGNISMWDENISTFDRVKRVERASRQAGIHDFVSTLPRGYNTRVGDRGSLLSGGQRQRISIARELYKLPSILILDEATNGLDLRAEQEVNQHLIDLRGQLSIILISHKLNEVERSDYVYVFDDGRIIESGVTSELLSDRGSKVYSHFIKEED